MKDSDPNKTSLRKKKPIPFNDFIAGIKAGNTAFLSRAITLVESTRRDHQEQAQELLSELMPDVGKSLRIGITGVPGVGKSTFIEAAGLAWIERGHRVAVLPIDPSSQQTKGSILGDKTRMYQLSSHPKAFIRPSPSAGSLGGVAKATRESMLLCEAAGYDIILVETVGVGQSETSVHGMVDFFLLLMLAGAGDELQGIKRGIMEMADALVINKADGDNVQHAKNARRAYQNALHLFQPKQSAWTPQVLTCSAKEGTDIDSVLNLSSAFENHVKVNGTFERNRKNQEERWLTDSVEYLLKSDFYNTSEIKQELKRKKEQVHQKKISPFQAATDLVASYHTTKK